MRKDITLNIRLQSSDDLIDFPVNDVYRDHYAAQGLTYPSGRSGRERFTRNDQRELIDSNQELDAARQEAQGWKSHAMSLEARCAKLEEEVQRLQSQTQGRRPNTSDYKGVALDVCA